MTEDMDALCTKRLKEKSQAKAGRQDQQHITGFRLFEVSKKNTDNLIGPSAGDTTGNPQERDSKQLVKIMKVSEKCKLKPT